MYPVQLRSLQTFGVPEEPLIVMFPELESRITLSLAVGTDPVAPPPDVKDQVAAESQLPPPDRP